MGSRHGCLGAFVLFVRRDATLDVGWRRNFLGDAIIWSGAEPNQASRTPTPNAEPAK